MEIQTALLANQAEVVNGLLNVKGASPEHWTVGDVPAVIRPALAGVFRLDPEHAQSGGSFSLAWDDNDGRLLDVDGLVGLERATPVEPGAPMLQCFASQLELPVRQLGRHVLTIAAEQGDPVAIELGVVSG